MEQIQQHEWVRIGISTWRKQCKHCELIKHTGLFPGNRIEYIVGHVIVGSIEPKCITRPEKDKKCPNCDRQYGPCECGKIL